METSHTAKSEKSLPAYARLSQYTIGLVLTLLVFHVFALGALYLYERNAAHDDLMRAANRLVDRDDREDDDSGIFPGLPANTIVLERPSDAHDEEYYEQRIGGREYHVYAPRDSQYVIAQSTYNVHREIAIFGTILAMLYFAEVLLIGGWWFFLRNEVKETFTVH